ncbi:MAG: glycosyltransferase family 4 protein [Candidatus Methanoperedens sp.]|nr:glycosyltransferase family 4 protein [Candidatus Methanoperedens sp.]
MSRVAMVCHRYYPDIGGVETHVREISERLVQRGFDVEVVCTDPAGKYPCKDHYNGVRITRFRSFAPKDAFYIAPQLYSYLKKNDYDIIHAHNYHAFPALFASAASEGRFIFTPHYHGKSPSVLRDMLLVPYRWIGCSIFGKADKVICVSKYEMKLIEKDFHIPRVKLIRIPNGLTTSEFKDIKELKKESKTILYAGRIESYKGIQYIIEALPLLPDYRLKIIGKGNYEDKLRGIARRLNVSERIGWLKDIKREELLSYFKSADVFVNLSTVEAYGITVAEALACGTPCIVAAGGALEEFIDGEGCVGLNYPINIETLARAIKSRRRIQPREMPDWNDVTSDLIRVYSEGVSR